MKIRGLSPASRGLVAAIFAITIVSPDFNFSASAQRLPSGIIPTHYTLTLTPDLKNATFTGVETVDIALQQPVNSITLNAADLTFQSVAITSGDARQSASTTLVQNRQQATFTFANAIAAGTATLSIAYTGVLNNSLRGFYLSKTTRRNYAVTQFEPTDARRAFPSFDEPAFKATFDVSLVVDTGDTAISNSAIASDTPGPGPGKHTIKFFTTPKMSTYLVAFLVGDFQCTTGEQDGVALRSCATPDKVALTAHGVEAAKFFLHYYNMYFGIPYPLKKLDLVAIPDFEAGAMENFGAITYRETALLIDEKSASIDEEKVVDIDIAHEMAHQWFGDLVTMRWWDNLWLNEGFASWMENKAVAALHPEWKLDQSVATDMDNTLNIDSQPTTRPIRAKADTPDEINQMFDAIAYDKASQVLLTVENFVGPGVFRQGIHNYLAAHVYSNATAEDFWNAQTVTSHLPVDQIMTSLVTQPGVPLLTFGEPNQRQVTVSQRRFYLSPSYKPNLTERWTLPVCFKESMSENSGDAADDPPLQNCQVLTPVAEDLAIPAATFLFANAGGKGYYRSAYPADVNRAIVSNVETALMPAERIRFIGDTWASLRANKIPVGDYLDLVGAMRNDPNAEVLDSAFGGVAAIYQRIAATTHEKEALALWLRKTYGPAYARLGSPSRDDSPNMRQLRGILFGILGNYGKDPKVLADAREIAAKYLADRESVDPTLAKIALAVAAHHGDAAFFDRLQNLYETSTDPEVQQRSLRLLADFENPALVERDLDFAVSGKVRNQDVAIQFLRVLQQQETRAQAWRFIQSHWDKVQAQLTTSSGSMLVAGTGSFCTASDRNSVSSFFSNHKVEAADVAVKHAIDSINGCMELRNLQEPKLKDWLSAQPQ